jgi:hypothetical protein
MARGDGRLQNRLKLSVTIGIFPVRFQEQQKIS